MSSRQQAYPIIDLHCDMTHYLTTVEGATPEDTDNIGCAIAYLRQGNVKLQVMAISSVEPQPDTAITRKQVDWYKKMLTDHGDTFAAVTNSANLKQVMQSDKVGIVPAVENASALCGASDTLEDTFVLLNGIISECGRPLYISLTHHRENRFGGGNMTDIGLKDDGRALLEYISGRKIAVDLSHTSDKLAHDIIDHIDPRSLELQIIASHSNLRAVYDHPRNLPDDLAKEIIDRRGLIGMNFLRAFMHPTDPDYLRRHIAYGLEMGGGQVLALGADYFYTEDHPDPTRKPFYFEQHEHAGKYQEVLATLSDTIDVPTLAAMASGNAVRFFERLEETD